MELFPRLEQRRQLSYFITVFFRYNISCLPIKISLYNTAGLGQLGLICLSVPPHLQLD